LAVFDMERGIALKQVLIGAAESEIRTLITTPDLGR
jgi:hypothetical protein